MPSLKCKCGNLITRGSIPNPNAYRAFKDIEVEDVVSKVRNFDEFEAFMTFNGKSIEVLKCDFCNRLWIDVNSDLHFVSYVKEMP